MNFNCRLFLTQYLSISVISLMFIIFILPRSLSLSSFRVGRRVVIPKKTASLYCSSFVSHFSTTSTAIDNIDNNENEYSYHIPVLRDECCDYLNIKQNGIYVDCTLGGGGHTKVILERGGRVIGLDQDPDAIAKASSLLQNYIKSGQLEIIQTNFRHIADAVLSSEMLASSSNDHGHVRLVDGVLMDLGISSHQIDEPTRGFSFSNDGPLDMRMSGGKGLGMINSNSNADADADDTSYNIKRRSGNDGITASKIINEWDSTSLANLLYEYGDETRSRQIAREIISSRPLNTTNDLVTIISKMTPWKHRPKTLARCFQALRIAVNDEMGALDDALATVHRCVRPGGRLVIISYHSLEDRRVKKLFHPIITDQNHNNYYNVEMNEIKSIDINQKSKRIDDDINWMPLFKRAQAPTNEEIERNKRSRSAKLRVAERYDKSQMNDDGSGIDNSENSIGKVIYLRGKKIKNKKITASVGAKQLAKMEKRIQEDETIDDDDDDDDDECEEDDENDTEKINEDKKRNKIAPKRSIFRIKK